MSTTLQCDRVMALNPTKWKLNKAEQKEVEELAQQHYNDLIESGADKKEAQEKKEEYLKTKTLEMKSAKSAKSAAKKAAAAAAKEVAPKSSAAGEPEPGPAKTNSDYLAAVQEAKNTILRTDVFKRIEAENPLPIQQKDGGVQVRG